MRFLQTIMFTAIALILASCVEQTVTEKPIAQSDDCTEFLTFDNEHDVFTGGVRMIPIQTEKGTFNVYTKRVGNNPKMRVLLLHGGPGGTHEFFECFESYFPKEGIEFIYYDQLGSFYSDQPNEPELWNTERFVEEVEQVRVALGLNKDNFYLYGQSWGGILGLEYALKYQQHLKGLIVSNMVSSIPEYNRYAQETLGPAMAPEVFAEIQEIEKNEDWQNPRYMELLMQHHYTEHILRMPIDQWPNSINRAFDHFNMDVYVPMQGFSEFGVTGDAYIKDWDVRDRLKELAVATLTIGGQHDTMDPEHMKWMSEQVQNGRYLHCPNGSHLVQYDDQKTFFDGLIKFILEVDAESKNS